MKRNFFIAALFFLMAGTTFAVEIPADMQGKWITDNPDLNCKQEDVMVMTIDGKSIDEADISSCEVKKVSGKDGKYKISTRCCSQDGCSSALHTENYEVKNDSLTIGTKKMIQRYKRCPN